MNNSRQSVVVLEHVIGRVCGEINRLGGVIKSVELTEDGKKEVIFDLPHTSLDEFNKVFRKIRIEESENLDTEAEYCSFCGKERSEVESLVFSANKSVSICNECVALSVEILSKDNGS